MSHIVECILDDEQYATIQAIALKYHVSITDVIQQFTIDATHATNLYPETVLTEICKTLQQLQISVSQLKWVGAPLVIDESVLTAILHEVRSLQQYCITSRPAHLKSYFTHTRDCLDTGLETQ